MTPTPASTHPRTLPDPRSRRDQADAADAALTATGVSLAYDQRLVVDDLDVAVPRGKVTVIVGANACGKSTLLRGLARLLRPTTGTIHLDGHDIHRMPTKAVARRLGLLPQSPIAPSGITVGDLVGRGRQPHQRWFAQWSDADEAAVIEALEATGTSELASRPVDELSGGQRQRVWIAMALAQRTPVMLLDEPTTYLDLAHQIEVLDLLRELNTSHGRTIVLVLHDLNQAARYGDHLIAMRHGRIVAEGPPVEVVTADRVQEVFGLPCRIITDPVSGTPLVLPLGAAHRTGATPVAHGGCQVVGADLRQ
ncbi:ABC transporter ATP-binding protein [Euzebya rosea]|uniref:ABC transporter ATP-binding protein n=1 Tax=Euzebya rosea TaxID=2052804 RepID=UPI000D3ED275|nr:ABC transporter ATP-binding protein [Euzebya rosea]